MERERFHKGMPPALLVGVVASKAMWSRLVNAKPSDFQGSKLSIDDFEKYLAPHLLYSSHQGRRNHRLICLIGERGATVTSYDNSPDLMFQLFGTPLAGEIGGGKKGENCTKKLCYIGVKAAQLLSSNPNPTPGVHTWQSSVV